MCRGILVQVANAAGVEARRPPDDTVDLIALGEEELGQVRAILQETGEIPSEICVLNRENCPGER
jgi:hypothetical protein